MRRLVVDASVGLKWVVDEEGSEAAAELNTCSLLAPAIVIAEWANALWAKTRRGELEPTEAALRLRTLRESPVQLTPINNLVDDAFALAQQLRHPVYDCFYLALAVGNGVPVVTADKRFLKAVRSHGEHTRFIHRLGDPLASHYEAM